MRQAAPGRNIRYRSPKSVIRPTVRGTRYRISHARAVESWHSYLSQVGYKNLPPIPIAAQGQCEVYFEWGKWDVCTRSLLVKDEYRDHFEGFRQSFCVGAARLAAGRLGPGQMLVQQIGVPHRERQSNGQAQSHVQEQYRPVLPSLEALGEASPTEVHGVGSEGRS